MRVLHCIVAASLLASMSVVADTQERQDNRHSGEFDINVNFACQPLNDVPQGVTGCRSDEWNFMDYGDRELRGLQLADGSETDVVLNVSENDGEWGISDHEGVFHGYIYHNCRCVDLTAEFHYLQPGTYDVYVIAHGDAPDQNAAIEVQSGDVRLSGKSTLNDGSWDFRNSRLSEGNQYVRYLVEVQTGDVLKITSRRDGSSYSMLNAIQLKRRHSIGRSFDSRS